jgi:hypothetical protein
MSLIDHLIETEEPPDIVEDLQEQHKGYHPSTAAPTLLLPSPLPPLKFHGLLIPFHCRHLYHYHCRYIYLPPDALALPVNHDNSNNSSLDPVTEVTDEKTQDFLRPGKIQNESVPQNR